MTFTPGSAPPRAAGIDGVALATDTTQDAGGRTGIPFGVNGNLLLRRKDLLDPAGFTEAPKTWEELVTQAVAVNQSPVSGLGLALSNVGDANVQVAVAAVLRRLASPTTLARRSPSSPKRRALT